MAINPKNHKRNPKTILLVLNFWIDVLFNHPQDYTGNKETRHARLYNQTKYTFVGLQ